MTDETLRKILIVEDEPRNLKLVRDLLQAGGYETVEAGDGLAGVEAARGFLAERR